VAAECRSEACSRGQSNPASYNPSRWRHSRKRRSDSVCARCRTSQACTCSGTRKRRSSTSAKPCACATACASTSRRLRADRAGRRDGAAHLRLRVRAVRKRGRGAGPRVQPHQELPAAIQHPAQGRQELPLSEAARHRAVPARALLAPRAERRRALLRPLHVSPVAARNCEIDPPAAAVSNLLRRDLQAGKGVSRLPHPAVSGTMREADQPRGLQGAHPRGGALHGRSLRHARAPARGPHGQRGRPARFRERRAIPRPAAIDRTHRRPPEGARARPRRPGPDRLRAQGNDVFVEVAYVRQGKMVATTAIHWTGRATPASRSCCEASCCSTTRAQPTCPAP